MTRRQPSHTTTRARDTFRAMLPSDLDAVVRLDARAFGAPRRAYFERRLSALAREGAASHTIGLAAERNGVIAGFIMGTITSGEFGFADLTALVDSIAVHPEWQRRGTGRQLADAFIAECAARGVRDVYTLVNWNSWDMLKFFDSIGFSLAQTVPLRLRIGEPEGVAHEPA